MYLSVKNGVLCPILPQKNKKRRISAVFSAFLSDGAVVYGVFWSGEEENALCWAFVLSIANGFCEFGAFGQIGVYFMGDFFIRLSEHRGQYLCVLPCW